MKTKKLLAVLLSVLLMVSSLSMMTLPVTAAVDPYTTDAYEIYHGNKSNGDGASTGKGITIATTPGTMCTFEMIYRHVEGPGFEVSLTNGGVKSVLMNGNKVVAADASYDAETMKLSFFFYATDSSVSIALTSVNLGDVNRAHVAFPIVIDEDNGVIHRMDAAGWQTTGAYWNAWPYEATPISAVTLPLGPKEISLGYKSLSFSGTPYYSVGIATTAGTSYTLKMDYKPISGSSLELRLVDGSNTYTLMTNSTPATNVTYNTTSLEVAYTFTASSSNVSVALYTTDRGNTNVVQVARTRLVAADGTVAFPQVSTWTLGNSSSANSYSVTAISGIEKPCTHTYDNICDDVCNVCDTRRDAPHLYTNGFDSTCNRCGAVRVPIDAYTTNAYQINLCNKPDGDGSATARSLSFSTVAGRTYTFETIYKYISGPGFRLDFVNGSSKTLMNGTTVNSALGSAVSYDPATLKLSYTFTAAGTTARFDLVSVNKGDNNTAQIAYPILIDSTDGKFIEMNTSTGWEATGAYWNASPSTATTIDGVVKNALQSMTVNGATLTPAYQPWIRDYTVTVPAGTTSLDLAITPFAGATYEVLDNSDFSSGSYRFVRISTTPAGQNETITYAICVYVEPVGNNTLSSLSVAGCDLAFDPSVKEYDITVPNTQETLDISYVLGADAKPGTTPIIAGNTLVKGETTTVTVAVENKDGSYTFYTIRAYQPVGVSGTVTAVKFSEWKQDSTASTALTVKTGTTYAISFLYKEVVGKRVCVNIGGAALSGVSTPIINNGVAADNVTFDPTQGRYTYVFTAAANALSLGIHANNYSSPNAEGYFEAWIADFTLYEVDPNSGVAVNGGHTVAVDNTFTMADGYWSRPSYGGGFWNVQTNVERSFFVPAYTNSLSALSVNGETVDTFHPAALQYSLTVPYTTKTATLSYTLGTDGQSATIFDANGTAVNGTVALTTGNNVFTINVTNNDASVTTYTVTICREDTVGGRLESLFIEFADGAVLDIDPDTHTMSVLANTTLADILTPLPLPEGFSFACYDSELDYITDTYYASAIIRNGFRVHVLKDGQAVSEWTLSVANALGPDSNALVQVVDPTVVYPDETTDTLILTQNHTVAQVVAAMKVADGATLTFYNKNHVAVAASAYTTTTITDGFTLSIQKNGEECGTWQFATTTNTDMTDVGILSADAKTQTITVRHGTKLNALTDLLPVFDGVDITFYNANGSLIAASAYATTTITNNLTAKVIKNGITLATWSFVTAASTVCSTHRYSAACDTTCNACGETREAAHSTNNGTCTHCCRFVKNHVFHVTVDQGNGLSITYVITVTVLAPNADAHTYDNACDADCNNCGEIRDTQHGKNTTTSYESIGADGHLITNTCILCKEAVSSDQDDHTYDDTNDTDCNLCGFVRDAAAAPLVFIDNATAEPGETFTVSTHLANNPGIISIMTLVGYDATVLELLSYDANGDFPSEAISYGPDGQNPFTINYADGLALENNTTNGVIVTLTFKVKEDATPGNYALTLSYRDCYNFDWDEPTFETQDGTVTITAPAAPSHTPGDVTDDGKVNNKDLMFLQRYLNNWDIEINLAAADVTGDDKINNKDWMFLQRYLNNWDIELV